MHCLVKIGVLTPVQQYQRGTILFIITKKEGTVRFITKYHRLNQKLVRKPYPLPKKVETMQHLEEFQYATALDINMGYYTIKLPPTSQGIKTIVTEFGKLKFNRLPMGMCTSGDIFQSKVDKLLRDITGVKTYIDDILVLSKQSFYKHI